MKSNEFIFLSTIISIVVIPLIVGYLYAHNSRIKEKAKFERLSRNSKRVNNWTNRMAKRYEGKELDVKFIQFLNRNIKDSEDKEYMLEVYKALTKSKNE